MGKGSIKFGLGKNPFLLYLSIFLSAVGGFLFGYDTGVVAGAMPLIERDKDFFPEDKKKSDLWLELITTVTVGFAFVFSFIGGWLTERFGRRPAILTSSVVFTVGSIVMGAAGSKEVLLVGRMVVGMGIGLASMCIPVYMAESSPVELRGTLGASFQVMICLGQVVAACVDGAFGGMPKVGWKWDFGLAGIPSLILLVGFWFCPESPRWLVAQGKKTDARDVLLRMRAVGSDIDKELEEIGEVCERDAKMAEEVGNPLRRALADSSVRKATLVGCSLQLFQQLSGINTVIYFSARILMMTGITHDISLILWLSAGIQAINFVASFIGMALIDRLGRRVLTLGSYIGIAISISLIGLGFQLSEIHSSSVSFNETGVLDSCAAKSTCYDCTYEYDQENNEDLNCGFCYLDSEDGVRDGSCVRWDLDDDFNPVPLNGRCKNNEGKADGLVFVAQYCPTNYAALIMVGLALYLVSFQAGVGPVPWVYNPEIYPLWYRSTGVSMSTGFNWALNILVSFTFTYLLQALSFGTYYLYGGFSVLAVIWFYIVLPESKGRTLEEMENAFTKPLWRLGRG